MRIDPKITSEVIAHSVSKMGDEITTIKVVHPKCCLIEIASFRFLSRTTKDELLKYSIQEIRDSPFQPLEVRTISGGEASEEAEERFRLQWRLAARVACESAEEFSRLGIGNNIIGRVLDPFRYVTSLITATDWGNFYSYANHPDSSAEFKQAAYSMLEQHILSTPTQTELHIPFGDKMDHGLSEEETIQIAIARCANISYDIKNGIKEYKRLVDNHDFCSMEHVAKVCFCGSIYVGNLKGWVPHRKTIKNENPNPGLKKVYAKKTLHLP